MNMRFAFSLRFRLMIFYLIIFLVPATIMIFAMPYYFQQALSNETQTLTEGTLTSIAKNIETYLDDLNRLTITPYLNDNVMQAIQLKASSNYNQADDYTKLLADRALKTTLPLFLQNSRTDILATVLIIPDGTAYIASIGGAFGEPVADYPYTQQDWYRKAVQADGNVVFISSHPEDYLSEASSRQVFSVARLIKDPDTRQPLGVIMADADTVVLARIINDIHFNVSSVVCVFDDQSKLLYSSQSLPEQLQNQDLGNESTVYADGNSYITVSTMILPAQWRLVVLLSNAEVAAKTRWIYTTGILFAVGGLVLTFLLFFILSRWVGHPFQEMIAVMKQVQSGNLQARFTVSGNHDEISELGRALNNMIERVNKLIEREYKAVINQRNAEYRALQSQIHPHFIYNTLNSFLGLNRLNDTVGLEKAILALSGMLHYILESEDWVELHDEITFIERYCELQWLRFRERLTSQIRCDKAAEEIKIPKLLLQPLVENAMIHGIEPAGRPCTMVVDVQLVQHDNKSRVCITVQDDGRGFDPQALGRKEGLGLANVRERLRIAFPDAKMSLSSQINFGTKVVIEFPIPVEEQFSESDLLKGYFEGFS
jgi:two-component system sensor histidine kinase YesM